MKQINTKSAHMARRTPTWGPESPSWASQTPAWSALFLGRKPIVGLRSRRSGNLPSGLVLEHLSNGLRVPCPGSGPAAAQLLQPVYQTSSAPAEGVQGAWTLTCPGSLILRQFQLPWHCAPGKQKQHLGRPQPRSPTCHFHLLCEYTTVIPRLGTEDPKLR